MLLILSLLAVLPCSIVCVPVPRPPHISPWVPKDLKFEKFVSPAVTLKSGQVANTPYYFGPLKFPSGPVAIHYFISDVIDDAGTSVPLSEVYVHHWLIYATTNHYRSLKFNNGPCDSLPNIFGIGAELRHSVYEYPENAAVKTTGNETWTANLHLIRSTNVPDVQNCIECTCSNSNPPLHNHGEVGCCPDQGMCWGMKNSTLNDPKNYYLQYIIGYKPLTPQLDKTVEPIHAFPFDITAKVTYDCETDFDIPALPAGVNQTNSSVSISPFDIDVHLVATHVHIGGEYMGVQHLDANGTLIGMLCDAEPVYGTGKPDEAGNELGYLVKIPYCNFQTPYRISKGDQLKLITQYSSRTLPGGHPWHSGVMGITILYGVDKTNTVDNCIPKYNELCNPPPYFSRFSCNRCYERNDLILNANGCNEWLINAHCRQTDRQGNIPSPVKGLALSFTPVTGEYPLTVTLTAPIGVWFAMGWNPNDNHMENSTAFVVADDGTGVMKVMKRILGNHEPGQLVQAEVPGSNVTSSGGQTTAVFTLQESDMKHGSYNCVLFARGDELDGDVLQYHGAHRGWVCDVRPWR